MKKINFFFRLNEGDICMCVWSVEKSRRKIKKKNKFVSDLNYELINKKVK